MLCQLYGQKEAGTITQWVMEEITGQSRSKRLVNADKEIEVSQRLAWKHAMDELQQYKPVQYVLQKAWFKGMELFVNEQVLIPRPETEELVNQILEEKERRPAKTKILDIGTGSGCIAISLKKYWPAAEVTACDISEGALQVAQKNAKAQDTDLQLLHLDILDEKAWSRLDKYDIIVSNPPYIDPIERESMDLNVLNFEPELALFTAENDPLVFYRRIAQLGKKHCRKGGLLFLELHEDRATEIKHVFEANGYSNCILRKDLQGKWRMLSVQYQE